MPLFAAFITALQRSPRDAAAILRGHWPRFRRDRARELEQALTGWRRSTLLQVPELGIVLGLVLQERPSRRAEGLRLIADALDHLVEPAERPQALLSAILRSSAVRALSDRAADTGAAAERLRRLLPTERDEIAAMLPAALVELAKSHLAAGEFDEAAAVAGAIRELPYPIERRELLDSLGIGALAAAIVGEVRLARSHLEEIEQSNRLSDPPPTGARIAQLILAFEDGESAAEVSLAEEIWTLTAAHEIGPLLAYLRALADIGSGRARQGMVALDERLLARTRPSVPPALASWLDAARVALALAAGDAVAAREVLDRADREAPIVRLAAARIHLYTGAPGLAIAELRELIPIPVHDRLGPRLCTELYALLGTARRRLGDHRGAIADLSLALGAMREFGLRSTFWLVPLESDDELSAWAADLGDETLAADLAALPMPRHGLRAARPLGTLTEREQVILGHLESDLTRSEIAAELFVSENTLKAQLQSIFRKLGVRSRLEAVLVARENLPTTRADHPAT